MFNELKDMKVKEFEGVVYILLDEFNRIKIGKSRNPYQRFNRIVNASGCIIKKYYISDSCSNYSEIERFLLDKYQLYQVHGEWFKNLDYNNIVHELKHIFKNHDIPIYKSASNIDIIDLSLALLENNQKIWDYDFTKWEIEEDDLYNVKNIINEYIESLKEINEDYSELSTLLYHIEINSKNIKNEIQSFMYNLLMTIEPDIFKEIMPEKELNFYKKVLGIYEIYENPKIQKILQNQN